MFCEIVGVDPDRKGMDLSMQRILISSEYDWVFISGLVAGHYMLKVLLDNQVTRHVLKNASLVSNIRAGRKASIGGIDVSQTAMSAVQVCNIPYVGVGFSIRMRLPTLSLCLRV